MTRSLQDSNRLRGRMAAIALISCVGFGLTSCDNEVPIDDQQERDIRPGQLPEGSPREEEN